MWYLALRRNLQPRDTWKVSLDEHLAWMREHHERGSIILSGPSTDRALGIYLIRATSRPAAELIAASDPFTAAGHCAAGPHRMGDSSDPRRRPVQRGRLSDGPPRLTPR